MTSGLAFALHGIAVHSGALVIVQPIVVSGILFVVPLRDALDRHRPPGRVLRWVAVAALGLAVFAIVADPRGGSSVASPGWLVAVGLAAIAVLFAGSRRTRTTVGQGLLLSVAAGLGFGLTAGLLKVVVLASTHDAWWAMVRWPAWTMVLVGTIGFVLNQRSYQLAPLSMTMPLLNIVDVLVAVGFGWCAFGEVPAHDATSIVLEVIALGLMCMGVRNLAKGRSRACVRPRASATHRSL